MDALSTGEDANFGNGGGGAISNQANFGNRDNFTLDYSLDDLVNEQACELDRILAFTAEWPS